MCEDVFAKLFNESAHVKEKIVARKTFTKLKKPSNLRKFPLKTFKNRKVRDVALLRKNLVSYNIITTIKIYHVWWLNSPSLNLVSKHIIISFKTLLKNTECGNVIYSFRFIQPLRFLPRHRLVESYLEKYWTIEWVKTV